MATELPKVKISELATDPAPTLAGIAVPHTRNGQTWKVGGETLADLIINGIDEDVDALRFDVTGIDDRVSTVEANQVTGVKTYESWAALNPVIGAAGDGAEVLPTDAGTHTDPVVGGTVANAGRYVWSESPAGWKWSADGLYGKVDAVEADVTVLSDLVLPALVEGGDHEDLPSGILPIAVGEDGNIVIGAMSETDGPMPPGPIVKSLMIDGEFGFYSIETDTYTDNWLHAIIDLEGFVAAGVTYDGRYVTQGNGVYEAAPWPALAIYTEAGADITSEMIVTWHGLDGAPAVLEYRVKGAGSWMSAGAFVRDFPLRPEKVYSARLTGLSPDTIYETRPAGSGETGMRAFRTAPETMDRPLRMVFVSDPHLYVEVTDLTQWNALNAAIKADDPDLILIGGDFIIDNGVPISTRSDRWARFVGDIDRSLRRPDGTQIPIVAFAGNHDAGDGGASGSYYGLGPYGYIDRMFAGLFREPWKHVGGPGYGHVTVGNELLLVCLDTNHGSLLADQVPWLQALLAAQAANYRHVICAGHMSPFPSLTFVWGTDAAGPADRILRREIIPILQSYPNCKFHLCGHSHVLLASAKLKMDPTEEGTGNKWYADANGIRVLGSGGWASPSHEFETVGRVSDIDGSSFVDAALSTDGTVIGVTPISAPTNSAHDPAPKHYWRLDFDADAVTAAAINVNGAGYVTYTEDLTT